MTVVSGAAQPIVRHLEGARQGSRRGTERLQETLVQDLARMDRPDGRRARSVDVGEIDDPGFQIPVCDGHRWVTLMAVAELGEGTGRAFVGECPDDLPMLAYRFRYVGRIARSRR